MASTHNIPESGSRQIPSVIHDGHPLAPKAINRGRHTAILRNNYFLGQSLAILLCRATNGKVMAVTIDREDLEKVLSRGHWHVINVDTTKGRTQLYVVCRDKGKTIYLHRFVMNAPPKSSGVEVDHLLLRTMDNRKSQLRLATKSQNQRNRRCHQAAAIQKAAQQ